MNYNDWDDMEMNDNLHNGIGLTNSHTLAKYNESSNLNSMNWGF